MQLYQFLNAESTAVLQTETRRCIYLDQAPTIHSEAYIKWRDGWSEVIPAKHEVTTPYSSTTKPAWIEKVGDEYVEHPEETIIVDEVAVDTPEQTIEHPPHETDPYIAPEPVQPPEPTVPQEVSIRQGCLALEAAGLLNDVELIVATLPRPYQIEWQRASVIRRDNPLVEIVRQQQGLTVEAIDQLFTTANTL